MKTKTCTKCNIKKSISHFSKGQDKNGLCYYCKECFKIYNQELYQKIKTEMKKYQQEYYYAHTSEILKNKKKYNDEHKTERNTYRINKRQSDINYKLKENLRVRIWNALKGINKSKHTLELIGCTIKFLKKHLEKQFTKGMSWSNYGKWHVDHIKPCCAFDLGKDEEQKKCFHYSNLQPLWARDNLRKRREDNKFRNDK